MNNQEIIKQLNWRYAVKKFDSTKKVSAQDWETLEESLRLAPSSYGTQPWKFLVVQNPEVRKKLTPLSWNQTQIEDCSHLVVLAIKSKLDEAHVEKYIQRMAEVRKMDPSQLDGFKRVLVGDLIKGARSATINFWAQRQAYIAMGFIMETAAIMNIDTCPLEGLDPKGYDKVLNLEGTGYETVAAVAVGYRHADDKYQSVPKVRFEKKDVFTYI
jgi:nitroreductase